MPFAPEAPTLVPNSIRNLWHDAQISHFGMPSPSELQRILQSPQAAENAEVALVFQEATVEQIANLMVDGILGGATIHSILSQQTDCGRLRRPDLLAWSRLFS